MGLEGEDGRGKRKIDRKMGKKGTGGKEKGHNPDLKWGEEGMGASLLIRHVKEHLDAVRVVVQQKDPRAGHFLGLHHGLQVSQEGHVLGHVCGQHLWAKGHHRGH